MGCVARLQQLRPARLLVISCWQSICTNFCLSRTKTRSYYLRSLLIPTVTWLWPVFVLAAKECDDDDDDDDGNNPRHSLSQPFTGFKPVSFARGGKEKK